jgi:hypothetical protein
MAGRLYVASAEEWKNLPEIVTPTISTPKQSGSDYVVHKVGFVLVDQSECLSVGIQPDTEIAGRLALPTAVIELDGDKWLCRLPLELTPWAIDLVGMAQLGGIQFPTTIEFGRLDGRTYAELK